MEEAGRGGMMAVPRGAGGGWQRRRHGCVPMSVLKGTPLRPPHGALEPGFPDGLPG